MQSGRKRPSHALILRPPAPVLAEIAAVQARSGGAPVKAAALGMTLCWFGYGADAGVLDRVAAALAGFAAPPCRLVLNQLVATETALLLRPAEPLPQLDRLHASLAERVQLAPGWHFGPKLTIARGPGLRAFAIDPIAWAADAVELVLNHPGHRRRDTVGRWILREAATGCAGAR